LTSKRGSAGGYQLGRPANEITVGAVLRAVEGAVTGSGTPEVGGRGTRNDQSGDLAELWRDMAEAVSGVIDRMTFEDLRRRVEERREVARPMYHI
jgi:DNA-binding IscR family transcriptional regulator